MNLIIRCEDMQTKESKYCWSESHTRMDMKNWFAASDEGIRVLARNSRKTVIKKKAEITEENLYLGERMDDMMGRCLHESQRKRWEDLYKSGKRDEGVKNYTFSQGILEKEPNLPFLKIKIFDGGFSEEDLNSGVKLRDSEFGSDIRRFLLCKRDLDPFDERN
ncbi:Uncharacterized protein Fot_41729 [Forsythia ovata]|uniref:Uncharacterized protein n=1 Tax=Forsythia ovata TaxID=205694 RepID=A0ABD1RKJ8_9LAMI